MSAESEAFSALDSIESGRWDRSLLRLLVAIRMRMDTDEYKAGLIAGDK